jgi:nucleotide-binding universal stress UspA family protein
MYKNILIPTDGSELASKAVHHGIGLAKALGAKVTAVTVAVPFPVFTLDPQVVEETREQYKKRQKELIPKTLQAVVMWWLSLKWRSDVLR